MHQADPRCCVDAGRVAPQRTPARMRAPQSARCHPLGAVCCVAQAQELSALYAR